MPDLYLLGPQYRQPILQRVLESARIDGPLLAITAGWQEREGELDDLARHVGRPVEDLRLYARTEELLTQDPALAAAHRDKQARLQALRRLYLPRLRHAKAALRELEAESDGPSARAARRQALAALRRLDHAHLLAVGRVLQAFAAEHGAAQHAGLARMQQRIHQRIEASAAVLLAGGHLPALLNRLRLFALGAPLATRPLVAWSAGAMALAERVVLFHDDPPQGAGEVELFELGLGLARGLVLLPHAATRLKLDDPRRVARIARRFAPAACIALDEGGGLRSDGRRVLAAFGCRRLQRDGRVGPA